MRLFFAVAADGRVREAAAGLISRLRPAAGDCRWVDPRDMHVTLRFLGERAPESLPEAAARLRETARRSAPFELVFGALGAFDDLADPRVLWLGVREGRERLAELALALGYDEPRPYNPHLTLGRRRGAAAAAGLSAALRAEPALDLRRPVEDLCLYASRPAPFGHAYEILERARLGG